MQPRKALFVKYGNHGHNFWEAVEDMTVKPSVSVFCFEGLRSAAFIARIELELHIPCIPAVRMIHLVKLMICACIHTCCVRCVDHAVHAYYNSSMAVSSLLRLMIGCVFHVSKSDFHAWPQGFKQGHVNA